MHLEDLKQGSMNSWSRGGFDCLNCICEHMPLYKDFRKHNRSCHSTFKVQGTLCGNVFRNDGGLETHMVRQHDLEIRIQQIRCIACNTIFNYRNGLEGHNSVVHRDWEFSCSDCGNVFETEQDEYHHNCSG